MMGEAGQPTLLLVAYSYPPRPSGASYRPRALAKYLGRLGYRVIVLTSAAWGSDNAGTEPAARLVRAPDLFSARLNWRRRNVEAYEGRTQRPYFIRPTWPSHLLVPDLTVATWLPFALPAARRLARRERISCVLTTSPPNSTNLIGLALKRRGIPWLADLRDGWRFERAERDLWRLPDALDRRLESLVLTGADRVVTVSDPITDDLGRRLGIAATTIPNGYDPEEAIAASSANGLLDPERHSIVHTGSLASAGRSPEPLLEALRLLARRSPAELERLEVVFAGPISETEATMFRDPRLHGAVRYAGNLDRPEALRMQAEADSLLVVTSGARSGEVTGKLFEYLRAGRPILVLGENSEAARLVTRAALGQVASVADPERIASALLALTRGETDGFDPKAVERARAEYTHPRIAARMAGVIEEVRRRD